MVICDFVVLFSLQAEILPRFMSLSALAVLLSAELLSLVGHYQNGIHEDILPFRALKGYHRDLKPDSFARSAMTEIEALLGPWLSLHGHTRLPFMCTSIRRTDSVVLYGAYFGDVELLDAMAALFPDFAMGRFKHLPLVELATIGGSLPTVQNLSAQYSYLYPHTLFELAVEYHHLDIVQGMVYLLPEAFHSPLRLAVGSDDVVILHCLLPKCTREMCLFAMEVAVRNASMQCLAVLHAAGATLLNVDLLIYPAESGRIDILDFLLANAPHLSHVEMLSTSLSGAIRGRHVDVACLILDRTDNAIVKPNHVELAIQTINSPAMLELLWARHSQWQVDAKSAWTLNYLPWLRRAATKGRLDMVQCLVPKGIQLSSDDWHRILYDSARMRQSHIVKWLFVSGMVAPNVSTLERMLVEATSVSHSHLKTGTMEILHFVQSLLPPKFRLPTSYVLNAAPNEPHAFRFFWEWWWPVQDKNTKVRVGRTCVLAALTKGRLRSVKMLVKEFNIPVTADMLAAAKQGRCKQLIEFLQAFDSVGSRRDGGKVSHNIFFSLARFFECFRK
ncbi:Aste57867_1977 [Aphanomyces stellatus]|uniref:Aste57867_1977 protein n=1 Tax=Aphanomyces stellatus TaxID=120398 RepID=A0A485K6L0_9STRA|nr:hypothetical protein As57867_001975 [Aphanomyces stellatus]VFT79182.1 Aste57867_1977 [Aphanomyces stellatus]